MWLALLQTYLQVIVTYLLASYIVKETNYYTYQCAG